MKVAELNFDLPNELLAREPLEEQGKLRSDSKLVVFDRANDTVSHRNFTDITSYIGAGDALVLNNSQTIKASLTGWYDARKQIYIHLAGKLPNGNWQAYSWTPDIEAGKKLSFGSGQLTGVLVAPLLSNRVWEVEFDQKNVISLLGDVAKPIMSPYVKKEFGMDYYQTVFAEIAGSSELPAAGRHFTKDLLAELSTKGVVIEYVTLHTGLSSIEVSEENFEDHTMQLEEIEISEKTAKALNRVRDNGGRIFGVGTTVVRTLETVVDEAGRFSAYHGYSDKYIYPGYKFNAIDCFVTNFHGPKSSRIAMAAAFTGAELLMRGYREAIERKYRFYEFGDCTLTI